MDAVDLVWGGEENRDLSEGEEVRSVGFSNMKKYTVETTAHTLLFDTPELYLVVVCVAKVDLDGGIVLVEDDLADFPEMPRIKEELFR
jgi:hypothetical protein